MDPIIENFYIALIIISIIGYVILIGLAIYFLYIPAIRINQTFNNLIQLGRDSLDEAEELSQQISLTNNQVKAVTIGFCNFNAGLTPGEKELFWGTTFDQFCDELNLEFPTACFAT